MNQESLLDEYRDRHDEILRPLARGLAQHLAGSVDGIPRIDRIAARAKSPDRFFQKAKKVNTDGTLKYSDPFNQIQDLVGARIIVFYLEDVEAVSQEIERYYFSVERKIKVPESLSSFGYVGKHYILSFPEDLFADDADRSRTPEFFELQIKTLFQHAWSEADHDLGYKPEQELTPLQHRQMAFAAAQAWGADQMFATLHKELGCGPVL